MWNEGSFLGIGESPQPTVYIQERCEGQQISGVYWMGSRHNELPPGWRGMGLEFTNSAKLVVMAAPVLERTRTARLLFRWIAPEKIWTARMDTIYRLGLDRATPTDVIQQQVQGQLIKNVITVRDPTAEGGEEILFEFSGGSGMAVRALPNQRHPLLADLEVQMLERLGRA